MNTNSLCNEPCLILLYFNQTALVYKTMIVKLIIGDIPVDAILQNGYQEYYLEKDV